MKLFSRLALITGLLFTFNTQAALIDGTLLTFDGAPIDSTNNTLRPATGSGSWFSVETSPGQFVYTSVSSFNGLFISSYTPQPASGAHDGPPDGSENPDIDNPWLFFNNTGMHQTTRPVSILSQSGNTALLDFSGWSVIWSSQTILLDTAAFGSNPDGVALLTCAIDCTNVGSFPENPGPEAWQLSYTATVQSGAFQGIRYELHLESGVVPVPAAIWLFIPGLVGLLGMARRKTPVA